MRTLSTVWILCCFLFSYEPSVETGTDSTPTPVVAPAVGKVAVNTEEASGPRPLVELAEVHFKKAIEVEKKTLNQRLGTIDKSEYERFVKEIDQERGRCGWLSGHLGAALDGYVATTDSDRKAELLTKIRTDASTADQKTQSCVVAKTASLDKDKILVAGILTMGGQAGDSNIYRVVRNEGWAFILTPEIAVAWPGRVESGLTVLDPTKGPWRVIMTATRDGPVRTFSRAWTLRKTISVKEYLKSRSSGIHFLLGNEEGRPIGWIPWEKSAFYHRDWESYMKRSTDFYTKGLAYALHGAHYTPGGSCDEHGFCNNGVALYDFHALLRGQISGREIGPIPEETIQLTRIRDAQVGRP